MKKMAALSLCLGVALLPGCGMANMSTDVDKLLRAPQIAGADTWEGVMMENIRALARALEEAGIQRMETEAAPWAC